MIRWSLRSAPWTTWLSRRSRREMANFSSAGPTTADGWVKPDLVTSGRSIVSLAAPGSTIYDDYPSARIGSGNFVGSGTSFSSAITSGAAALVLADHPGLSPNQLKARLLGTTARGPVGNPFVDGHGALNAYAAATAGPMNYNQSALRLLPALVGRRSTVAYWPARHVEPEPVVGDILDEGPGRRLGGTWNGVVWNGDDWNGFTWTGRAWNEGGWQARPGTAMAGPAGPGTIRPGRVGLERVGLERVGLEQFGMELTPSRPAGRHRLRPEPWSRLRQRAAPLPCWSPSGGSRVWPRRRGSGSSPRRWACWSWAAGSGRSWCTAKVSPKRSTWTRPSS